MTDLPDHLEFEVKHRFDHADLFKYKQLLERQPGVKDFLYVEGPDHYYTHPDWFYKANPQYDPEGTFVRFRKPSYGLDNGRKEVTWKYKLLESKNNIQRTEHNWRVDSVPDENIRQALVDAGAVFNFSIVKACHIYMLEDATVVFYTVWDTTDDKSSKPESFLEIEINEEKVKGMAEKDAWAIIEKYEALMEPFGVSARSRLKRSLFGMYKRGAK